VGRDGQKLTHLITTVKKGYSANLTLWARQYLKIPLIKFSKN